VINWNDATGRIIRSRIWSQEFIPCSVVWQISQDVLFNLHIRHNCYVLFRDLAAVTFLVIFHTILYLKTHNVFVCRWLISLLYGPLSPDLNKWKCNQLVTYASYSCTTAYGMLPVVLHHCYSRLLIRGRNIIVDQH